MKFILKFTLLCLLYINSAISAPHRYFIMIDAGSSHTEMHVYQITQTKHPLDSLREVASKTIDIGISSYGTNPNGLTTLLKPLLNPKTTNAPKGSPVYLMATGGMRLLDQAKQDRLYQKAKQFIQTQTPYEPTFIGTIKGTTEGIFGWIAINYLHDRFQTSKSLPTLGLLDMGGASAEIVFALKPDQHSKYAIPIQIGDQSFRLFAKSFLGLGQNQAAQHVNAPSCFPTGFRLNDGRVAHYNPEKCLKHIHGFIKRRKIAYNVPADIRTKEFIALSEYFYIKEFFKATETALLADQSKRVCKQSWKQLRRHYAHEPEVRLKVKCFGALYHHALAKHGYHNLFMTKKIKTLQSVEGKSADWVLGAIVYLIASPETTLLNSREH